MSLTLLQRRRRAKALYRWCLVHDRLDQGRVRNVVNHIVQSERRGYLSVLGEFTRLVKLECAKYTAIVESAAPLESDLQSRVRMSLVAAYGQGLTTEFAENPELIGGMRVRIASDVFDGSVKARLIALARTFGINERETLR